MGERIRSAAPAGAEGNPIIADGDYGAIELGSVKNQEFRFPPIQSVTKAGGASGSPVMAGRMAASRLATIRLAAYVVAATTSQRLAGASVGGRG